MGKFQIDEAFRQEWALRVEHARSRPTMHVGNVHTAHHLPISSALGLMWRAKAFRNPGVSHVILSPTQFLIRCEAGPLIRPIQSLYTFGGGHTLGEPWRAEGQPYFERLNREDKAKGLTWSRHRCRRGWRYCFSGPTGPRLAEPSSLWPMAKRLTWGVKTNEGLWCETYEDQRPVAKPFLIPQTSKYGVFVMGDLDPALCTGLPYTQWEVTKLEEASGRKAVRGGLEGRGEIRAELRGEDFLQPEDFRLPGLAAWV
jgi:hypothetical protein